MTRRLPKPKPRWVWITVSTVIPAAVLGVTLAGVLSEAFRDWLLADESGSTTIRNLGLVLAGLIALPLAIWRGLVAEKQADAAQLSLRNERYQKGAEMLGSEVMSVRLGGIYALHRLAREHPDEYHIQVTGVLCAFLRHPIKVQERESAVETEIVLASQDVQAIISAISDRDSGRIALERASKFQLDLSGADLSKVIVFQGDLSSAQAPNSNFSDVAFWGTNLSNSIFWHSDFSDILFVDEVNVSDSQLIDVNLKGAKIFQADFTNTIFAKVNMTDAILWRVNFSEATFLRVNLSGADLSGNAGEPYPDYPFRSTKERSRKMHTSPKSPADILAPGPVVGLTQSQLDLAYAHPDKPPNLDGVLDAKTGQPLVWTGGRGAPL